MSRVDAVLDRHERLGRAFSAGGVRSFVREEGAGDPVVCVHGVPTSSFLFRKVLGELAARGLRGVAFDLPGLGLAERPEDFDYTWTGLGRFAAAAVDALGLDRFHLVVHDIGGPVGFELAAVHRDRIASLTLLNTMLEVDTFRRPWVMEPFAHRGIGEAWLASMTRPAFRLLMRRLGVATAGAGSAVDFDAYVRLLKREDGGRAFLRIMRGFERTREKRDLYVSTVRDVPYPVQAIWGDRDPALRLDRQGAEVRRAADLVAFHRVPGKHFLPEDQATPIARHVAALAGR